MSDYLINENFDLYLSADRLWHSSLAKISKPCSLFIWCKYLSISDGTESFFLFCKIKPAVKSHVIQTDSWKKISKESFFFLECQVFPFPLEMRKIRSFAMQLSVKTFHGHIMLPWRLWKSNNWKVRTFICSFCDSHLKGELFLVLAFQTLGGPALNVFDENNLSQCTSSFVGID